MANYVLKKKCNNCGAEIPRSASYCDICGARCAVTPRVKTTEEKRRSDKRKQLIKKIIKWILISLLLAFMLLIFLGAVSSYISDKKFERREAIRDLSGWETVVTKEEYEKIDVGMSYDEIVEIIGGPGKKIEDDEYSTTYSWPGEYYVNSYHGLITVDFYKYDFDDSKGYIPANNIMEKDIINGEESFETYKLYEARNFGAIDAPLVTKEQVEKLHEGLSIEKVFEMLGEGKLLESDTYYSASYESTHKTYIWRCKLSERDFYFDLRFENGILRYYSEWKGDYVD